MKTDLTKAENKTIRYYKKDIFAFELNSKHIIIGLFNWGFYIGTGKDQLDYQGFWLCNQFNLSGPFDNKQISICSMQGLFRKGIKLRTFELIYKFIQSHSGKPLEIEENW